MNTSMPTFLAREASWMLEEKCKVRGPGYHHVVSERKTKSHRRTTIFYC